MPTLTNESARRLGLPGWGERASSILQPGATVEVPTEYLEHLEQEVPGVAAFFAMKRGGIRVTHPVPVVAATDSSDDATSELEGELEDDADADAIDEDADDASDTSDTSTAKPARAAKPKKKRTR